MAMRMAVVFDLVEDDVWTIQAYSISLLPERR